MTLRDAHPHHRGRHEDRTRSHPAPPSWSRWATALAVITAALVTVVVGPLVEPVAAAAPVPLVGFAPMWANQTSLGFPGLPEADRALAVDEEGTSYVPDPDPDVLLRRQFLGGGGGTVYRWGPGTLAVRGLDTIGRDVIVAGALTGQVTLEGTTGPVVLDRDDGSIVVLRLDPAGRVRWSRVIDTGADVEPADVFASPDALVLTATVDGPTSIDGFSIDPDGGYATLVVGLDPVAGTTRSLTAVETDPSSDDPPYAIALDGSLRGSTFAMVGIVQAPATVRTPTSSTPLECDGSEPAMCSVLVRVDASSGATTLARPVGANSTVVAGVAVTDDGFAVLGASDHWSDAFPPEGFIRSLDADGDERWSQPLIGLHDYQDVEVDHRGDLVVADVFFHDVTIGTDSEAIHLEPTGLTDALVVELDPDGTVLRATTAAGLIARVALGRGSQQQSPSILRIGPGDEVILNGAYDASIAVGTGPRAIPIPGAGSFLAAFPPDLAPGPGSTFHATAPTRLLDSRTATGGWNAKLGAQVARTLTVAGTAGVPSDATAVVLNVTATDVTDMTFLTAWPAGRPRPVASNLNVVAGDTVSNHITVAVGSGGAISLWNAQGSVNLVADLFGYYAPDDTGSAYHSMDPVRLLDSRTPTGAWNGTLVAGWPRSLGVAGAAGIPADAEAVVLSVTVTDTSDLTYLRVEPNGDETGSSNIAVNPGQTITNLVTTKIGVGGELSFRNNTGSVNVVADVVGWYDHDLANGSRFHAVTPVRALDSRYGVGTTGTPPDPWLAGTVRAVPLDGLVPTGAPITGLATNLTATDTTAMSYVTIFAAPPTPATSNLLFTPGQTIAAAANTGVGADGTVSLFNQLGSANLILDVDGYFVGP